MEPRSHKHQQSSSGSSLPLRPAKQTRMDLLAEEEEIQSAQRPPPPGSVGSSMLATEPTQEDDIVGKIIAPRIHLMINTTEEAGARDSLTEMWTYLRNELQQMEKEKNVALKELEERRQYTMEVVANLPPDNQPAPFAPSSPVRRQVEGGESSIRFRDEFDAAMYDRYEQLRDEERLSKNMLQLQTMTTTEAKGYLQERRLYAEEDSQVPKLGCWLKAPDANVYPKVNLKGKYGHNAQLSHIAVIAGGRGTSLRSITQTFVNGKQYHASHLCGNKRCFNPEHVYVEESEANEARKTCQGHYKIVCGCKTVYHPCDHARVEGSCGFRCVLPTFEAQPGHGAYCRAMDKTWRPSGQ